MPNIFNQGTLGPYPWLGIMPKTQFGIAQQFFVNRTPLTARTPVAPIQNYKFSMVNWPYRGRVSNLATAIAASNTTTLGITDASGIMNGDVLVMAGGEICEVTADPNLTTTPHQVTVRRGACGTTALAAIASPSVIVDIGNSRTGGEKFQSALQQIPTSVTQYVQTFQHVVSVAGILQDMGQSLPMPPNGGGGPYPQNKMNAMRNCVEDIEVSSLYGFGEDVTSVSTQRAKQIGIMNFLTSNAVGPVSPSQLFKNPMARQPTSPSAYKPTNFITDVIQPIRAKGGDPSVIHVSSGWMAGLAQWANTLQKIESGTSTSYGVHVTGFSVPILGNITFVENFWLNQIDPTLATHSALVLTESMVRFRELHALDYQPYARTGDTGPANNNGEGDWIARMAIEVDNEPFHGFVTGITGFAAQT